MVTVVAFLLVFLIIASVTADGQEKSPKIMCVTLKTYGNHKCDGEPVRQMSFPTLSEPGSPCYHDSTMNGYSVKNQHCTEEGTWKQQVYILSDDCKARWWNFMSPQTQEFTTDKCLYGIKLGSCVPGPCNDAATDTVAATDSDTSN
mmetsp:Transcript_1568/g.3882  ORF Transcript_1568/g.3882 Transcript_1568/m.3882 type:complete len:146 (+) Transcript_1568:68-505(+)